MKHFEKWWKSEGQYVRAGGGDYEKSFAFAAWNYTEKNAPSWHDAPNVPGLWVSKPSMAVRQVDEYDIAHLQKYGRPRWYGPIPPDSGEQS
jgi:hypothetical protein